MCTRFLPTMLNKLKINTNFCTIVIRPQYWKKWNFKKKCWNAFYVSCNWILIDCTLYIRVIVLWHHLGVSGGGGRRITCYFCFKTWRSIIQACSTRNRGPRCWGSITFYWKSRQKTKNTRYRCRCYICGPNRLYF